jgi:enolase
MNINDLNAWEILDSRGRPTLKAVCRLASGAQASASVPSGASTGSAEAVELRDGDPARYGGLGCRRATENVNRIIAPAVTGKGYADQKSLDADLLALDGTPSKSHLGANAILVTSLAFARAAAVEMNRPLHAHFADMAGEKNPKLPQLTINLFSGGKHAGGQVPIQDCLMVPLVDSIDQGLAMAYAVYQSAARLIQERYDARPLKADEGGLAPPFANVDAMLTDAVESIRRAGLQPGRDMAVAVDVASSHFFQEGRYHLENRPLDSRAMIDRLRQWTEKFPIISIEDGLAEEDWDNWPLLRQTLGDRILVLGDDFLCTNPARIARAVKENCCTALLLKVNQVGTLTEAAEARRLARAAAWKITVSARSGETEDNWLADLATAWGDQIKVGSICQSERLAKYNRLLEIEREGLGFPRRPLPSQPKM